MILFQEGAVGQSTEYVCTAETQLIASGDFGTSRIQISIQADSLRETPLDVIRAPGVKYLKTTPGTTLKFRIVGTVSAASIDLSAKSPRDANKSPKDTISKTKPKAKPKRKSNETP